MAVWSEAFISRFCDDTLLSKVLPCVYGDMHTDVDYSPKTMLGS